MSTERELREKRDIDYKKLHNGTTFEADKELTPVKTTRVVTCHLCLFPFLAVSSVLPAL
jgi:hypothetical protein